MIVGGGWVGLGEIFGVDMGLEAFVGGSSIGLRVSWWVGGMDIV